MLDLGARTTWTDEPEMAPSVIKAINAFSAVAWSRCPNMKPTNFAFMIGRRYWRFEAMHEAGASEAAMVQDAETQAHAFADLLIAHGSAGK